MLDVGGRGGATARTRPSEEEDDFLAAFTIGYEGRDVPGFVAVLKQNGVTLLVDVRDLPSSRKKGFSKTPLAQTLHAHDIRYLHMRELGTPRSMREQLRRGGDYERFFAEYRRLLQAHDEAVCRLVQLARTDSVCLMCFEHDHRQCHRHVLAETLRAAGVDVTHL